MTNTPRNSRTIDSRQSGDQAVRPRSNPLSQLRASAAADPSLSLGRIELCEPRLALSVSLPLDLMDDGGLMEDGRLMEDFSTDTPVADLPSAPALFEQAREIRETSGLDGRGQTAVVIDTGITPQHITLGGQNRFGPGYRVVAGWDFAENDAIPLDDGPAGFHGTHVASVLAGRVDPGSFASGNETFEGIASGSDLVSLRVFDDTGRSNLDWIESALQWVHQNKDSLESPITTVNLSIGTALNAENAEAARAQLSDELAVLAEDDILVFAAAGNFFEGDVELLYPASDPHVVAVAALDDGGSLSEFTQRSESIFAAGGRAVRGAVPEHVFGWDGQFNDFANLDGSSMATPQIAGASMVVRQALIESGLPSDGQSVLSILDGTAATGIDPITGVSFRRIDLMAAIEHIDSLTVADIGDASRVTADPADAYLGDNASETLGLDLNRGLTLTDLDSSGVAAGSPYQVQQRADGTYFIDAGDGNDRLTITGGNAAERLILRAGSGSLSEIAFADQRIELLGFEQIHFVGGPNDRVTLFDSVGDDTLHSSVGQTQLQGIGYQLSVSGVSEIYVHATSGGNDTAFLNDSAGDDQLVIRPQFTSLRSAATHHSEPAFQLAYGFEQVHAQSRNGGRDGVQIYDSMGDDTLSFSPGRTTLAGPGYQATASGFGETIAHAINPGDSAAGGVDAVRVYLDDSDDPTEFLSGTSASGRLAVRFGGLKREAIGFENAEIFENYTPVQWDEVIRRDRAAVRQVFEDLGRQR